MSLSGSSSLGRALEGTPSGSWGHSPARTPRGPGRPSSSSVHRLADRQRQLLRAVDEVEVGAHLTTLVAGAASLSRPFRLIHAEASFSDSRDTSELLH